ncbi:MAG: hypothetical protein KQA41_03750 [Candidatus Aenigmarchaeota archaeon]|nr:hypothetical protein [Candidatus Aenigmarchaeota archaeon]
MKKLNLVFLFLSAIYLICCLPSKKNIPPPDEKNISITQTYIPEIPETATPIFKTPYSTLTPTKTPFIVDVKNISEKTELYRLYPRFNTKNTFWSVETDVNYRGQITQKLSSLSIIPEKYTCKVGEKRYNCYFGVTDDGIFKTVVTEGDYIGIASPEDGFPDLQKRIKEITDEIMSIFGIKPEEIKIDFVAPHTHGRVEVFFSISSKKTGDEWSYLEVIPAYSPVDRSKYLLEKKPNAILYINNGNISGLLNSRPSSVEITVCGPKIKIPDKLKKMKQGDDFTLDDTDFGGIPRINIYMTSPVYTSLLSQK